MKMRGNSAVVLVLIVANMVLSVSAQPAWSDWPQFRGPNFTGATTEGGVFSTQGVGLEVDWRSDLGSGYSSISVVGNRAVTMYADGDADVVAAFDSDSGEKVWEYRLGNRYVGHTGSADGPAGTPAISEGRVFGLGRVGHLFSIRLEDGSKIWSRELDLGREAKLPHYGFATTPLIVGDSVVVQTGGPEGRAISAYDVNSGEPVWSVDNDSVNYQSPALMELGGKTQIVALNDTFLIGIDSSSGAVLWRYEHQTHPTEAFSLPLALGDDRILINSLREAVAVEVRPEADGYAVGEIWRSRVFGGSYSTPVVADGYLYGFRGQFLSCVEAASGDVVWKSRPPGGRGLIMVNGRLVINGKDGDLVVVEASPEGYKEVARIGLFEQSSYTPASFSGGRIFLRDLESIVAVRVTESSTSMAAAADSGFERELMGDFGNWVAMVEAADNKEELIDALYSEHEAFPIVEDGGLVHFVYRGEVEDIALAGTFLALSEQIPMDRIAGTDLYFRSFQLDPRSVWEYYFDIDLGTPTPDPKNPHTIGTFFGPGSVLRMPEWSVPSYLPGPEVGQTEAPEGRIDSFELRSEIRDNTRRIQVYLPAGYSGGSDRYPLMVMHYGQFGLNAAGLDKVLDNLIAERTAPFIVVLLPQSSLEEGGGEASGDYLRFVTDELIPFMDRNYRTISEPGSRVSLGIFDGGTLSVYAALKAPEIFGTAVAQSSYLKLPVAEEIYELMEARKGEPLQFHVRWTSHDLEMKDGGIDCAADSKRLSELLSEAGFEADGQEFDGSWGWGTWRAQMGPILEAMFPPPSTDEG